MAIRYFPYLLLLVLLHFFSIKRGTLIAFDFAQKHFQSPLLRLSFVLGLDHYAIPRSIDLVFFHTVFAFFIVSISYQDRVRIAIGCSTHAYSTTAGLI